MKIRVTNIPVHAYATGIVTVPDGTPAASLEAAVRDALLTGGICDPDAQFDGYTLDEEALLGGWELSFQKVEQ